MKAISLKNIVKAINGSIKNEKNIKISNICIDSRKVKNGDLFIPIAGENFDGHDYINMAFDNGAAACISHKDIESDSTIINVSDTKIALGDLARYYLSLFDVSVIAITGSVGKTSTKDMIYSVLSQKYNVVKTMGNYNNDIGLPLTIFNIEDIHDIVVLEMGMSDFLEIDYLSSIAKPDIAIITNIGVSHIQNLKSREGIFKAKCEIFNHIKEDGIAILNGDDEYLISLRDTLDYKKIFYGQNEHNDCYFNDIIYDEKAIKASVTNKDKNIKIDLPCISKHMLYNTMPSIILGDIFAIDECHIKKGIGEYSPSSMRMQRLNINDMLVINDAYNASPDSTKSAIDVIDSYKTNNKKIIILGDMLELGQYSDELHSDIGEYINDKDLDIVICMGKKAKYIYNKAKEKGFNSIYMIEKYSDILDFDFFNKGDIILLKASRGMHFEEFLKLFEGMNM